MAPDFRSVLDAKLASAQSRGLASLVVKSGDLHREVGGYPGPNHRMPVCCEVMRQRMQAGDRILEQPPKGNGATLKIQYQLPR